MKFNQMVFVDPDSANPRPVGMRPRKPHNGKATLARPHAGDRGSEATQLKKIEAAVEKRLRKGGKKQ